MNAILVVAILSLAMPCIYGEEAQVEKKQEKRGLLGLGYGYGGLGNALVAGPAYGGHGQSYLGGVAPVYSAGHGISAPAYGYSVPVASHGYIAAPAPVYSTYRIGYSGGLGHGAGVNLGGLGHGGVAYATGLGYARGLGHGAGYGIGYGAGLVYGAGGHGLGAGLGIGYGHGW